MSAVTNDMQAFVTGSLLGAMSTEAALYRAGKGIMKITNVRPLTDDEGNYLPMFTVEFESGTTLVVSVSEVTEIIEEDK